MGCDGGTIPTRDELVKTRKKPEQKDKESERQYRWKHCAVSQSRLESPIVSCELGRLYSKEEIISRLLTKSDDAVMAHIKNLKDIKELRLTRNPSFKKDGTQSEELHDTQPAEFICPITSQEMNGNSRFYFIWSCGCVMSERALKEIKSENCHVCNQLFKQSDVIPLNPTDEESIKLQQQMFQRREQRKLNKKEKRKRNAGDLDDEKNNTDHAGGNNKKKINSNVNAGASSSKAIGPRVSSHAAAILRSTEFKKIRSADFSVAKDHSKSDVFKSIFDSHGTAKNKPKSHWITCNPQYY